MGRGRSGATNQKIRNGGRFGFVIKSNSAAHYFRERQKKEEALAPFPPEFVEALRKIDPRLFACSVLES